MTTTITQNQLVISSNEGRDALLPERGSPPTRFRPMPGRLLIKEREHAKVSSTGIVFAGSDRRDATRAARGTVIAEGTRNGAQVAGTGADVLFDRLDPELHYVKLGDGHYHIARAESIMAVLVDES
jgi:co-chaperonin GroES (HSP10)